MYLHIYDIVFAIEKNLDCQLLYSERDTSVLELTPNHFYEISSNQTVKSDKY